MRSYKKEKKEKGFGGRLKPLSLRRRGKEGEGGVI
jgi:hypothetical protein